VPARPELFLTEPEGASNLSGKFCSGTDRGFKKKIAAMGQEEADRQVLRPENQGKITLKKDEQDRLTGSILLP